MPRIRPPRNASVIFALQSLQPLRVPLCYLQCFTIDGRIVIQACPPPLKEPNQP